MGQGRRCEQSVGHVVMSAGKQASSYPGPTATARARALSQASETQTIGKVAVTTFLRPFCYLLYYVVSREREKIQAVRSICEQV